MIKNSLLDIESRNILFSPPDITEAEIEEVIDTMKSGWITTGPRTKEFERRIADYVGVNKAVCLNSATAAMELTLRILGVGPGDEVITTAYTYTASASVIDHVGAKIVMVDVAKDSFEMDYDNVKQMTVENDRIGDFGIYGDHEIRPKVEAFKNDYKETLGTEICNNIKANFKWFYDAFDYM